MQRALIAAPCPPLAACWDLKIEIDLGFTIQGLFDGIAAVTGERLIRQPAFPAAANTLALLCCGGLL